MIPESLGNKSLTAPDECDDCNASGSVYEGALATHLSLVRLFAELPGKPAKGRPVSSFKHRLHPYKSHVLRPSFSDAIKIELHEGEESVRLHRIPDGVSLRLRVPSYTLGDIARALVRMALFVCEDDDLLALDHCRRWLLGAEQWPVKLWAETIVPRTPRNKVGLILVRNFDRPDEAPYILQFTFASYLIVLPIPGPEWQLPREFDLPFGSPEVSWDIVQFAGEQLRDRPVLRMDLGVAGLIGVPPPTAEEIAVAAYFRWQERRRKGAPDDATDDWLEAEQDLLWEQAGRVQISS